METTIFGKATLSRPHSLDTMSNIETYLHAYACTRDRYIKFMSIMDIDAKAKAAMSMFAQGERTQVRIKDYGYAKIISGSGQYKFNSRAVKVAGRNLTHVVIMHRSLIDDDVERPAIISNGNIVQDTIYRLAKIFAIPTLAEWHNPLYNLMRRYKLIEDMKTWTVPSVDAWRNLSGVTATRDLTQEKLLDVITVGIQNGELIIPNGNDAPDFDPDKTKNSQSIFQTTQAFMLNPSKKRSGRHIT